MDSKESTGTPALILIKDDDIKSSSFVLQYLQEVLDSREHGMTERLINVEGSGINFLFLYYPEPV